MTVIALLSSDWHFSSAVPVARSAEPSWYAAMKRVMDEIEELKSKYKVPCIVAGDISDRWNANSELTNFLLDHMPSCYTICGQHDLSWHVLDDTQKTAYGTLVRAGKVIDLGVGHTKITDDFSVFAFPWKVDIKPLSSFANEFPNGFPKVTLAVCHAYIWKEGFGYYGASEDTRALKYRDRLRGYSAAVFGDNHKGFLLGTPGNQQVLNCGTLMRRKSDERSYRPMVGLLHDDGHIEIHYLSTDKDLWLEYEDAKEDEKENLDISEFVSKLNKLGVGSLDFRHAVRTCMDIEQSDQSIRNLVEQLLE